MAFVDEFSDETFGELVNRGGPLFMERFRPSTSLDASADRDLWGGGCRWGKRGE